jgi:excisionase family DNA binding protein
MVVAPNIIFGTWHAAKPFPKTTQHWKSSSSWPAFSPAKRLSNIPYWKPSVPATPITVLINIKELLMSIQHAPEKSPPSTALYTVAQIAERFQVSTKTVRRWIEAGDLIAHRFGRQLRISEPDLMAFIRMRREA